MQQDPKSDLLALKMGGDVSSSSTLWEGSLKYLSGTQL